MAHSGGLGRLLTLSFLALRFTSFCDVIRVEPPTVKWMRFEKDRNMMRKSLLLQRERERDLQTKDFRTLHTR